MSGDVPFHQAEIERYDVNLYDGAAVNLEDGRTVELWKVEGEDGLCVRLFRPTNDGKRSNLTFGLTTPAAYALATLLIKHLEPDAL